MKRLALTGGVLNNTAPALDTAFSEESESLTGLVLASDAGHSVLALSRRVGLQFLLGRLAGHSAGRLARSLVRASDGALIRGGRDPIWTGIPRFWGPVLYQLSYAPTGGIQGFAPKNALRSFSHWWRPAHGESPFTRNKLLALAGFRRRRGLNPPIRIYVVDFPGVLQLALLNQALGYRIDRGKQIAPPSGVAHAVNAGLDILWSSGLAASHALVRQANDIGKAESIFLDKFRLLAQFRENGNGLSKFGALLISANHCFLGFANFLNCFRQIRSEEHTSELQSL